MAEDGFGIRNKTNNLDNGGEKGIRTLDTFNSIHAFQAGAFNHSAISPLTFIIAKVSIFYMVYFLVFR